MFTLKNGLCFIDGEFKRKNIIIDGEIIVEISAAEKGSGRGRAGEALSFPRGGDLSEGPLPGAAEGAAAHRGDGGIQPPYHPGAGDVPPPPGGGGGLPAHDGAPDPGAGTGF